MNNFVFYSPTEFVFGKDTDIQTGTLAKKYNARKAMIVYGGGSIIRSGLLQRIEDSLQQAGVDYVKLGGVQPNPTDPKVYEGIELARKEGVDFMLPVGGGSVIDTAKAIAAGVPYEGDFHLLENQPLWAAFLGAVFCGCGIGLGFSVGGSTGGTDIIAAIVNKYRDISLGRVIMICDIFIISSSYLVVHDWEKVLYGYVVLCVQAFCIDQVVNSRRRSVQFFIISQKYEEIGKRINVDADRGVTVVNASGFYSGQDVKMLFVLAKQRQAPAIFRLISEIDPHAFVSQSAVIGVYGEGFDKIKYKSKKEHGV